MTTSTFDLFEAARRAMIDSQLRTSGVNDSFVLDRMGSVPREDHVPQGARGTAYTDRAIRLPDGGFLPAPLFHGLMLMEANPGPGDRVLIVDGGSGYLPELVRPLVASVETISAKNGVEGKAKTSNATLLLVDGAIEYLPEKLTRRLVEGGRVVTGLIERGVTRLATGRSSGGAVALLALAETGVPRLAAFDREAGWSF